MICWYLPARLRASNIRLMRSSSQYTSASSRTIGTVWRAPPAACPWRDVPLYQHRDLLLGAAGEPLEAFRTCSLHPGEREPVTRLELSSREKIV